MNKAELVMNYPVNGTGRIIKLTMGQKVTAVSIKCMTDSANPLLIGWNENASANDYLLPGESQPFKPTPGNYLDGNEIRLKFGTIDGSALVTTTPNRALVKLFIEGDKNICKTE